MTLLGIYPGVEAPEIEANTLAGTPFKLSALRGKIVLVDFWATWCGPCVAELPNVRKLYEEYHAAGLEVVSISIDQNAGAIRKFLAKQPIPWPQIWAENGVKAPLSQRYGVTSVPATFLVGPDGRVRAKDLRGDELANLIEKEIAKQKR